MLGADGAGAGLATLLAETGLDDEDARMYVAALTEPGALTAALNWYRAMDLRWAQRKPYESVKNPAPFFFIGSEHDTDLEGFHGYDPLAQIAHQYAEVPAIEMVPKAGHMLQMERPREVNSIILNFLADLRPEL